MICDDGDNVMVSIFIYLIVDKLLYLNLYILIGSVIVVVHHFSY